MCKPESCKTAVVTVFSKVSPDGSDNDIPESDIHGKLESPSAEAGPSRAKHKNGVKVKLENSEMVMRHTNCA